MKNFKKNLKISNIQIRKPKISILMAAYNMEKYIAESIESMLSQTFKDFELIIIDDLSKDNTSKIIISYAKKDERIKIIRNKKNIGFTKSLNVGLKVAKGKYAGILDSDDVALPNRLKIEYDYLEKHKDIFLVGGAINYIDEDSKFLTPNYPITGFENIKNRLKERNCLWHSTVLFRNNDVFYREKFRYSQDYDLYTRLVSEGKKINNLSIIISNYRIHKTSTSYARRTIQFMFVSKIAEFYIQRLKTGKDQYEIFKPEEILNFDVENTKNPEILKQEMKASWEANDFLRARKFASKYLKYAGSNNKAFAYYVLSYFHPKIISVLRNIKNIKKSKK